MKSTCPFCQNVIGEAEEMGVKMNLKDIITDPTAATELEEKGGKRQVPFLVDEEKGESMYESNDIIKYLQDNYADGEQTEKSFNGLRIHKSDESCDTCQ